jgi:hypothetical protein
LSYNPPGCQCTVKAFRTVDCVHVSTCCKKVTALLARIQSMKLPAFLLAAVLLLAPFGGDQDSSALLAAGQGLNVGVDNLGAGADATALEFEQFESALELATTGGRGRYKPQ